MISTVQHSRKLKSAGAVGLLRFYADSGVELEPTSVEFVIPPLKLPGEELSNIAVKIRRAVAEEFGLTVQHFLSPRKEQHVTQARQLAAWAMRKMTSMGLIAIARALGQINHTSACAACKATEQRLEADPTLKARVDRLLARIEGGAE